MTVSLFLQLYLFALIFGFGVDWSHQKLLDAVELGFIEAKESKLHVLTLLHKYMCYIRGFNCITSYLTILENIILNISILHYFQNLR